MTTARVGEIRSKYTIAATKSGDKTYSETIDYDDIQGSITAILGDTPHWCRLVADLFEQIKERCDQHQIDYPEIIQIKIKFGELRIYSRTDNETFARWISTTTEQADHSCCKCGNAASMQKMDGAFLLMCCWCAHEIASERHPERTRFFGDRVRPVKDYNTCHKCGYAGQINRVDDRNLCPVRAR